MTVNKNRLFAKVTVRLNTETLSEIDVEEFRNVLRHYSTITFLQDGTAHRRRNSDDEDIIDDDDNDTEFRAFLVGRSFPDFVSLFANLKLNKKSKISECSESMDVAALGGSLSYEEIHSVSKHEQEPERRDQRKKRNYDLLKEPSFQCSLCSFRSKRRNHLIKHESRHLNDSCEILKCDRCDYKCIRASTLAKHQIEHSDKIFKCDRCSYLTHDSFQMKKHAKYKHSARESSPPRRILMYKCLYCDYKTSRASFFSRHSRRHTDDTAKKKQSQNTTSTSTTTSTTTKINDSQNHSLNSNLTRKIFRCDHENCSYVTNKRNNLSRHVSSLHSGERKFLCDFCGVGFKRRDTLKAHIPVHADLMNPKQSESLIKCSLCSKVCRSQSHLKEHHASNHENSKNFLCDVCGLSFKTKSVQTKHRRTVHKDGKFSCRTCGSKFDDLKDKVLHEGIHQEPESYSLTLPNEEEEEEVDDDDDDRMEEEGSPLKNQVKEGDNAITTTTYLINKTGHIILTNPGTSLTSTSKASSTGFIIKRHPPPISLSLQSLEIIRPDD